MDPSISKPPGIRRIIVILSFMVFATCLHVIGATQINAFIKRIFALIDSEFKTLPNYSLWFIIIPILFTIAALWYFLFVFEIKKRKNLEK